MKKKYFLLLLLIITAGLIINSCKKDTSNPIQTLFTGGKWQLASVMVFHFVGNTKISTDTLNDSCKYDQFFTFQKDNTCTYVNFDCLPQPTASGTWSLTDNKLFLQSNMVCKDTTAVGSSQPFSYSSIINLGQFSMVLQTGDIQPNYSLTKKRTVIQYGFIRQKSQ
ncbi:DUF5004 domain-containing protein [Mucilaginibacter sp.]|uniref:DUF5004 domain-containing protein n=1 Tax=Mucilaginibacter sp. TaxID=1882438 RepID=UPI003D10C9EF